MKIFIRYDSRPGKYGREYRYQVAYGLFSLAFCYVASPFEPRGVTAGTLRIYRQNLRRTATEYLKHRGFH